jgi:hypothetical protein
MLRTGARKIVGKLLTDTLPSFIIKLSVLQILTFVILTWADREVGIGTRYGLECPGIEFRWERDFPRPFRPTLGPTHTPLRWIPGLFLGVKRPVYDFGHPTPRSAKVKEGVVQYPFSPFGPSRLILG